MERLFLGFGIFIITVISIANSLSCVSKYPDWRLCHPNVADEKSNCRCHDIEIDGRGGHKCDYFCHNEAYCCYVADEMSGCSDRKKSKHSDALSKFWNQTVASSYEACEANNIKSLDVGNDDKLDGIEIVGDDEDFYKILAVKTYKECREECKKRFFCRSWTFFEDSPSSCHLRGSGSCCNQKRKQVKNSSAISGYDCAKNVTGALGCWSTEGPCQHCNEEDSLMDLTSSSAGWKTCRSGSKRELYWPATGECYNATEQGPCEPNEILALRDDLDRAILESVCIKEPCIGKQGERSQECGQEIIPKCNENEGLILNNFGHPVCACDTSANFYPLSPSLRFGKDATDLKKCHKRPSEAPTVCSNGEELNLENDEEYPDLTCVSNIVPFDIASSIVTKPCFEGYIWRFGRCNLINGC